MSALGHFCEVVCSGEHGKGYSYRTQSSPRPDRAAHRSSLDHGGSQPTEAPRAPVTESPVMQETHNRTTG